MTLPTAVVWASPDSPDPAELLTSLGTGGIHVVRAGSSYMAAAEVCRLHRARRRAASDNTDASTLRLVIVGPSDTVEAAAICLLLWQYAPGAPCWLYGPPSDPKLRPVTDADLASWSGRSAEPAQGSAVNSNGGAPAAAGIRAAAGAPSLRLAAAGSPFPEPKPSDTNADLDEQGPEGADASRPMLTPEELEMLLGDADEAGR